MVLRKGRKACVGKVSIRHDAASTRDQEYEQKEAARSHGSLPIRHNLVVDLRTHSSNLFRNLMCERLASQLSDKHTTRVSVSKRRLMTHRLGTRVVTHPTQCREPQAEPSSGVRDSGLRVTRHLYAGSPHSKAKSITLFG